MTLQQEISDALHVEKDGEADFYDIHEDHYCTGLVTRIYNAERRLYSIPFQVCTICHVALICETTRSRAYLVEWCEGYPILMHDVTAQWKFEQPKSTWLYGGYYWTVFEPADIVCKSFNVQSVMKLFYAAADQIGLYILSGNNCHVACEVVRSTLGIANVNQLHYGTYIKNMEIMYDQQKDLEPIFYL